MITKIITVIGILLFGYNIIREILVYRDIKSYFYCYHCNTFNPEIAHVGKENNCIKCHRSFKIKEKQWDHIILHRVNWIPASGSKEVLRWKEYRKLSVIEITISSVCLAILLINLVI